jgi:hypothetical protein
VAAAVVAVGVLVSGGVAVAARDSSTGAPGVGQLPGQGGFAPGQPQQGSGGFGQPPQAPGGFGRQPALPPGTTGLQPGLPDGDGDGDGNDDGDGDGGRDLGTRT